MGALCALLCAHFGHRHVCALPPALLHTGQSPKLAPVYILVCPCPVALGGGAIRRYDPVVLWQHSELAEPHSAMAWRSLSALAAVASLRDSQIPLFPQENKSQPAYYRDAIAVAIVIAATAIRLTFLSVLGTHAPYLLFYPSVIFAALYGGLRAGLLATALSAILADYFWIEPIGSLFMGDISYWLSMVIFLLSGAMDRLGDKCHAQGPASASAAETRALLASEREASMKALWESRAKLESALASMTDAVFISDTEGHFIDFNDAFATFHRFRSKEECGKTFAEYPDILDVFMANGELAPIDQWAVPRALRGETATNVEYTLRRKDTGETWVGSYSFGPIRGKDAMIVGSVVTARDITEHKQMDEEIKQRTAQLEAANKELESFAYSVSHDLRAPLRAIDGFSQMLLKDIGDKLDPESTRKFKVISSSTEKMGQFIDDLLSYSRTGRAELSYNKIDMKALVEDVWKELNAGNP